MKPLKKHVKVNTYAVIERLHYAMIEGYMQSILWCVR